ncbi:MAG: YqgE/AlgH family protein [Stellaceae bacterium]
MPFLMRSWRAHPIALALLFAAALPGSAAAAGVAAMPFPGQLLVASRSMNDPRFHHAVILILRHDQGGAFGIVINRPVGERSIKDLLADIGDSKEADVRGSLRVFAGGPVEPQLGFVIHTPDYRGKGTLAIDDEVAMTASRAILVAIGHGRGPKQSFIAFGYAGWAAGQLEHELAEHAWYTAPGDPTLIFDTPRADLWDKAMALRLREL